MVANYAHSPQNRHTLCNPYRNEKIIKMIENGLDTGQNDDILQDMTPKRQRFVQEYLKDCNGTQAAIRAGYSSKTAGSQAERLLRNVALKQAVDTGLAKRTETLGISKADNLSWLARVRDTSVPDVVGWNPTTGTMSVKAFDSLTPEQRSAIESFEVDPGKHGQRVKIKFRDSIRAQELILKVLGQIEPPEKREWRPLSIWIGVAPPPYVHGQRDAGTGEVVPVVEGEVVHDVQDASKRAVGAATSPADASPRPTVLPPAPPIHRNIEDKPVDVEPNAGIGDK